MLSLVQDILFYLMWPAGAVLILLILVQGGSGDMSSSFGGSQLDGTLGVGANRKLARITGWLAFLFIVAVLVLAIPDRSAGSLVRDVASEASASAPAERAPAQQPQKPAVEAPAATTAAQVPPPAASLAEAIQAETGAAASAAVQTLTAAAATAASAVATAVDEAAAAASAAVPGGLPFELGR